MITLIAPFCEESLKEPDLKGITPASLATTEALKTLLSELFESFEMSLDNFGNIDESDIDEFECTIESNKKVPPKIDNILKQINQIKDK